MYAPVIQAMATEQIRQHRAVAAAAGRARQIRRARRRPQTQLSVPPRAEQAEGPRARLRVVT
jgi:hypothetical protein